MVYGEMHPTTGLELVDNSFVKLHHVLDDNFDDKCKVCVKSDDKPDDNSDDKCKVTVKLG